MITHEIELSITFDPEGARLNWSDAVVDQRLARFARAAMISTVGLVCRGEV